MTSLASHSYLIALVIRKSVILSRAIDDKSIQALLDKGLITYNFPNWHLGHKGFNFFIGKVGDVH